MNKTFTKKSEEMFCKKLCNLNYEVLFVVFVYGGMCTEKKIKE